MPVGNDAVSLIRPEDQPQYDTAKLLQPEDSSPKPNLPMPFGGPIQPGGPDLTAPSDQEMGFPAPGTGTFRDKLGTSLASIKNNPAAPAAMSAPGGWAKMMIGATMDALSGKSGGLLANLGDAAAATEPVPQGGGALTGVLRTIGAGQQRQAAEKQQTFENKLKTDRAADEHLENQARVALIQGQTRLNAINVSKADNELQDSIYSMNKNVSDQLAKNHHVQANVSQAELDDMIKNNPGYLQTHRAVPVGRENVLDNNGHVVMGADGKPKTDQIWNVFDSNPLDKNQHVQPDEKTAKDWEAAGIKVDPNQQLTADDMITLNNRAAGILLVKSNMQKAMDESYSQAQFEQVKKDMESPAVQHAINANTARPLQGLQSDYNLHVKQIKDDKDQIAALSAKNPQDPQLGQLQSDLANKQSEMASLQHFMVYGVNDKMREDEQKAKFEDEQAAWQNRRAAALEKKELTDKSLAQSYQIQNKEFDLMRKPIAEKLGEYANLQMGLDMRNAEGDAIVAPMLLKALVAGGGVRITQAEINMVLGARSALGSGEVAIEKTLKGQKFSDEQRQQIRTLADYLQKKIQQKKQVLEAGQAAIDAADTVDGQRKAVRDTRKQIDVLDSGRLGGDTNDKTENIPATAPAGKTHMQKPDGTFVYVPNELVPGLVKAGGKVVQ